MTDVHKAVVSAERDLRSCLRTLQRSHEMMANALKHRRHEMTGQSIAKIESAIARHELAMRLCEFGLSRMPEGITARARHLTAIMGSLDELCSD